MMAWVSACERVSIMSTMPADRSAKPSATLVEPRRHHRCMFEAISTNSSLR